MANTRRVMLGVFVSALLAPAVLAAQGRGKGHGRRGGGEPRFWPGDRTIILDYVGENPGVVSAEGRRLPPGLAKNLRRGKPLPPGWQKKIGAFPTALEQRLSQLPGGYRRVIVDRWALVIAEATNTVMDVIDLLRH